MFESLEELKSVRPAAKAALKEMTMQQNELVLERARGNVAKGPSEEKPAEDETRAKEGPRMNVRSTEEILEYTTLLAMAFSQLQQEGRDDTNAARLVREHLQLLAWVLNDPAGNSIERMIEEARKHQSAIKKRKPTGKNSPGKDKK